MDNAEKLLELARGKFGKLSGAEEKLFRAVANGEKADYSAGTEEDNDPAKAKDWGEERRLKADRIAWLCSNKQTKELVAKNGIWVQGAYIEGKLNLQFAKIPFLIDFEKCAFPSEINLQHAEIFMLNLGSTHTGHIKADGLKVEGGVFLRNGFKVEGEVRLLGATIGGDLDCSKGQFINKEAKALSADGLKVEGRVFLHNGFKAEGEVRLLGATIGGDLDCSNGQFINKGTRAINADKLKVESDVYLRSGFQAEGEVCIVGAVIKGHFVWLTDSTDATLDMRSAKVGVLWDDKESWPGKGRLFLDGLVYDKIDDDAPKDARSRIEWLHRQDDKQFRPQPYEQLAEVFRKGGHDEDAREVLIQKNKDKARLTKLTFGEWLWYRFFGLVIGYGYRPLGALKWIALFIVLGWVFFGCGYKTGLITPESESAYAASKVAAAENSKEGRAVSELYPKFNSLVYSIEAFVPVVNLYIVKYWLPNANRGAELFKCGWFTLRLGGLLRFYFWAHICFGWILTTLFVVGLTGLVRT